MKTAFIRQALFQLLVKKERGFSYVKNEKQGFSFESECPAGFSRTVFAGNQHGYVLGSCFGRSHQCGSGQNHYSQ